MPVSKHLISCQECINSFIVHLKDKFIAICAEFFEESVTLWTQNRLRMIKSKWRQGFSSHSSWSKTQILGWKTNPACQIAISHNGNKYMVVYHKALNCLGQTFTNVTYITIKNYCNWFSSQFNCSTKHSAAKVRLVLCLNNFLSF